MLTRAGIKSVGDIMSAEAGRRAHVAGLVTHRQRPGTAGGVTFLNLEDETGMLNVVCTRGVWRRYRPLARNATGLVIRGLVERQDGVTNLVADKISSLDSVNPDAERALRGRHQSRDFH
jgi:error-prone DNA polymerase